MTIDSKLIEGVHSRRWERMNNLITSSGNGMLTITDSKEQTGRVLIVCSAIIQYLYDCKKDHLIQLPSFALAGTFGAGATGTVRKWSNTLTATTGGTTTKIVITTNINDYCIGEDIIFRTGSNAGQVRKVINVIMNPAGGASIFLDSALGSSVANTDTFQVSSGLFFILGAGTLAAGSFKSYDPLTGVITSLTQTGLPASWATDGRLISTSSEEVFALGTATSATGTTITTTGKTWATDKWINYQVRITAGTGIGQVRKITDSDATSLTVATWTVTPDATSQYVIEGDENAIYLIGNNAVTMYKYTITGDATGSWATVSPTVARSVGAGSGMSGNWVQKTGDSDYDDENTGQAGTWILSFRGAGTSDIEAFNIAGGTAGAGAWKVITYPNKNEGFTAGSAYALKKGVLYIRKDNTHRYFQYDIVTNTFKPFSFNAFTDGVAVTGDKTWLWDVIDSSGNVKLTYLYSWRNTGTELFRTLIY